MHRPDIALAVLTQFDTYMRPGELLSIPAQDFLTPNGFVVGEKYGFLIHPIKARGLWRSNASVRRYAKAARGLSEANEFDNQILLFGEQVKEVIREHFLILALLPQPPL